MYKEMHGMIKKRILKGAAFIMAAVLSISGMTAGVSADTDVSDNTADNGQIMEWQNYSQYIYNTTNGLMSNNVTSLVQTDDGMVWIGTGAGLAGYDGNEFTEYGSFYYFDGVNDMVKTRAGSMWCATTTYGAAVYLGSRFHHFDDVSELVSNYATAVAEGNDGIIYVGSLRNMIAIDPEAGYTRTELAGDDYFFTTALVSGDKYVCGITVNGDVFFMSGYDMAERLEGITSGQSSLGYAQGYYLVGMSDGSIGIIDENNIDKGFVSTIKVPMENAAGTDGAINNFYYEEGKRLWVLSEGGIGYYVLDKGIERLKDCRFIQCTFDNFESGFTDMMMDYQGNYWISSSKRGALLLRRSEFKDELLQLNIDADIINSVYKKGDIIYAGTDSGLIMIDTDNDMQLHNDMTELYDGRRITDIAMFNGVMYFAVYGEGVYDEQGKRILDEKRAGRIQIVDGDMYMLAASGCYVMDTSGAIYAISEEDGLFNTHITGAIYGSFGRKTEDRLYLSSRGAGIYVFLDGVLEEIIDENTGLPSKNVNDMAAYDSGFFMATDMGVAYYNGKRIAELKRMPEALEGKKCENLFISGDDLYVVCQNEVFIVSLDTLLSKEADELEAEYVLYDSQSGFYGTVTEGSHGVMDDGGRIYIACQNKIFSYAKKEENTDLSSLKLMLQSVKVDERQVEVIETGEGEYEVSLTKDAKTVDILCSVFNFSNADPEVRYILHGVDNEFTEVRLSELDHIIYENLDGGSHVFWFELLGDEKDENGDAVAVQRIVLTINKEKGLLEKLWVRMALLGAGFGVLMYFVFKDRWAHKDEKIETKNQNDVDKSLQ